MFNDETHVQVRVISPESLVVNLENGNFSPVFEEEVDASCCGIGGSHFKSRVTAEVLLIHIHGGGFVAMSSGSHQNYTRVWANDL